MQRPWLGSYPAGVPSEVDLAEFASLADLFKRAAERYGPKTAFVNMGRGITYRELDAKSHAFAAFLQSGLRLEPGARIAIMLPNTLQYPVAMFGALRAGLTVVNCNPLYTQRELEHQLADSGAEAIVVMDNFAATVGAVLAKTAIKHVVVTRMGDMLGAKGALVNLVVKHVKKMVPAWSIPESIPFKAALKVGRELDFIAPELGPDDLAFLQYTGGTTGVPKGAMLTHGNMVANLQQAHAWVKPFIKEGRETIVTALPLYHIFALTANCLTFIKEGATNVLITNPRDIPAFVKDLKRHPFSIITGVNTLFNALLNNPDFTRLGFTRLKISLGGGMAVQRAVAERWKAVTGKPLIEAYGLTETSPAVTINPLDLAAYNGSIGLPLPNTDVSIRDDDGNQLPPGRPGELCVAGPQVMKGYWGRPEETAKVLMTEGYLRTGDIAVIDDAGFVRIVDRKKDMILVSGFNVYPNEIEDVVGACPGVLEVGAVGVPDPVSGEVVKIAIVRKDPGLTQEDVLAYCRKNLTGYKMPRLIEFRRELPKTNVGKILRRALREPEQDKPAPPA